MVVGETFVNGWDEVLLVNVFHGDGNLVRGEAELVNHGLFDGFRKTLLCRIVATGIHGNGDVWHGMFLLIDKFKCVDGDECCRFGAQSAIAEGAWLTSMCNGAFDFGWREVTFGSDEDCGVEVWKGGFEGRFCSFVAMCDKGLGRVERVDERVEGSHGVKDGLECLVALFHCRNDDFVHAFELEFFSFAMFSEKRRKFLATDFGRFFEEPFCSFVEFGWCECHVEVERSFAAIAGDVLHLEFASFVVWGGDDTIKRVATTVHNGDVFTCLHTKHTYGVLAFGFRKGEARGDFNLLRQVGNVEDGVAHTNKESTKIVISC